MLENNYQGKSPCLYLGDECKHTLPGECTYGLTTWYFVGFCCPFEYSSAPQGQEDQLQKEREGGRYLEDKQNIQPLCLCRSITSLASKVTGRSSSSGPCSRAGRHGRSVRFQRGLEIQACIRVFSSTISHCVQRVKPIGSVYGKGHVRTF